MYYVNGVGLDIKDNQYEVYLQLISFADVATSESPNTDAPIAEIVRAKGKSMEYAIYKLYRSIDLKVYWGHMAYLILTEEALKNEHASQFSRGFYISEKQD